MTRAPRMLGWMFALAVVTVPVFGQGAQDAFSEGIDFLRRGRKPEALSAFQRGLAAEPSADEAYELWKGTDSRVWTDMLVEGGEFELIAKRFMSLAREGKKERLNDVDAIRGLVGELRQSEDGMARRRAVQALSADHGEYAVPYLVRALADPGDEDWRVSAMNALKQMDTDVVLPLIECLDTTDPFLRRNVALTLGYIGDARAGGVLKMLAQKDTDGGVVKAATEAAMRCGATGPAVGILLKQGDDYHHRRPSVLRLIDYSDVIWSWDGNSLVPRQVPRAIYNNVLSKKSYARALVADASSLEARAGIARAAADIQSKLARLSESGEDVEELLAEANEGSLAIAAAGVDALDLALGWSVRTDDSSAGILLCRALSELAAQPTAALIAALQSSDASIRGEAAAALGEIAVATGQDAGPTVVNQLSAAAGKEIVRIAAVIDGNTNRADSVTRALVGEGVLVNHRGTGAAGLGMLHQVPGLDLILVGDQLPDMTLDQVLSDISRTPTIAGTPIILMTGNAEMAELYRDRVVGVMTGPGDLEAAREVFSANLTGDRAQADELAHRAATALAHLARSGKTNVASAVPTLASTLTGRSDAVVIPAMQALAVVGTSEQATALAQLIANGDRSDEARAAAANALGGILSRFNIAPAMLDDLVGIVTSDASLDLRRAVAGALGRAPIPNEARARLLGGLLSAPASE